MSIGGSRFGNYEGLLPDKKGRKYYGCEDNPECDFMAWQKPSGKKCPECGNIMLEKGNKLVCADQACGYTEKKQ